MKRIYQLAFMLVAMGFTLTACDSKDEPGAKVKFMLTDAPTFSDYKAVTVDVRQVLYSTDGEGWRDLPIIPTNCNLLDLTNGKDTLLANIVLNEGERIQQVRLILGTDNSVTLADGRVLPLTTPSGQASGLKINVHQNITSSSSYAVVIDFDASRSIVAKGNGELSLKPTIRAYVQANTSAIYGTIMPSKIPFKVYTVTGTDTVATLSDTSRSSYFMLHGLATGHYDVVFETTDSKQTVKTAAADVVGGTDKDMGVIIIQ